MQSFQFPSVWPVENRSFLYASVRQHLRTHVYDALLIDGRVLRDIDISPATPETLTIYTSESMRTRPLNMYFWEEFGVYINPRETLYYTIFDLDQLIPFTFISKFVLRDESTSSGSEKGDGNDDDDYNWLTSAFEKSLKTDDDDWSNKCVDFRATR